MDDLTQIKLGLRVVGARLKLGITDAQIDTNKLAERQPILPALNKTNCVSQNSYNGYRGC